MANGNTTTLSIGLPVYNGERFLRFAIDSILSQTFKDFELIICDNASTDSTKHICMEYMARDPRIRYHRNVENLGAAANFNLVFSLARGKYFKWAAADDVISPDFVERCVHILDQDPSVVLAYSMVDQIDSSGEINGTYDYPMRVDSFYPHVRFADLILINHFCVAVFGVIRREVLEKTPLIGKYVGSDRVLLAELGLRGRFIEIQEYLFHRRDHPQTSGRMFNLYKRLAWFDPTRKNHLNLVYWTVGTNYVRSIFRVPLKSRERLKCLRVAWRWFRIRRHWLTEDFKAAAVRLLPFSKNLVQFARRLNMNK